MKLPKLGRLEFQVMDVFWTLGASSIREVQQAFPEKKRPAYTTVQTTVYRLEAKKALRHVKTIGKAKVFEPAIPRIDAQTRLIDELVSLVGGDLKPVFARLLDSGKLTSKDIKEIEQMAREHGGKDKSK